jgi:hypothetical protein
VSFSVKRFLIVAAICLAGCSTSPKGMLKNIQGFELPVLPAEGKALVYVVRPSDDAEEMRFNVFLDGQDARSEMGHTHGEEYIYFNITPGEHKIYSKAERWAEIAVSAKAGDTLFLNQEPDTELLTVRNNLVRIQEYAGRYHVKNLQLGTVIRESKE